MVSITVECVNNIRKLVIPFFSNTKLELDDRSVGKLDVMSC